MARDRQRAKQRQAERRAKRIADQGDGAPSPAVDPELTAGAPPEDEGRADQVLRDEPEVDELDEDVDPELVLDAEEAGALETVEGFDAEEEQGDEAFAPRGRRGDSDHGTRPTAGRGRVLQFLSAVVAELRRVQWPDRQALTTLTGIVLGFVLIAGGYLGLLDAIFSRVVNAIL